MHPCIHASMHPCMHPCIHASMHGWMDGSMHACIHACIHASMHPCIHASMHPCIHASMHPCIHAWMDGWMDGVVRSMASPWFATRGSSLQTLEQASPSVPFPIRRHRSESRPIECCTMRVARYTRFCCSTRAAATACKDDCGFPFQLRNENPQSSLQALLLLQ